MASCHEGHGVRGMEITRRDFIKKSIILYCLPIFSPITLYAKEKEKESWLPAYYGLEKEGTLDLKVEEAYTIFENCVLCPRRCGVNRLKGEKGFCRAPAGPVVFSSHPHFGEEISLVGRNGSGTIFFSNCNLRCVFCQNWPISHMGKGTEVTDKDLANMMIRLQNIGCHNINVVTPTHVMPNILNAVRIGIKKGLRIPLVYNTSGYERIEILKILDGFVDIYLPDMKYMDADNAEKYSAGASDYPKVAKEAIREMNRQVGEYTTDNRGIAIRGLMIRHLVMPNRVAGTEEFVRWVAESLSKSTYVNIMPQYRVEYMAFDYPEIARGITVQEFLEAMEWARKYELKNLDPRSEAVEKFYRKRLHG
jgi:putative pyruvate formate lyase activating enzyme